MVTVHLKSEIPLPFVPTRHLLWKAPSTWDLPRDHQVELAAERDQDRNG